MPLRADLSEKSVGQSVVKVVNNEKATLSTIFIHGLQNLLTSAAQKSLGLTKMPLRADLSEKSVGHSVVEVVNNEKAC